MKSCIHVVTLAVADLNRALAFYRDGLGFARRPPLGDHLEPGPRCRDNLRLRQLPGVSLARLPLLRLSFTRPLFVAMDNEHGPTGVGGDVLGNAANEHVGEATSAV
jgi:uncharacterized protein